MAYFTIRVYPHLKRVQYGKVLLFSRSSHSKKNGLILGVYHDETGNEIKLTKVAESFNGLGNGKLSKDLAVPCSTTS